MKNITKFIIAALVPLTFSGHAQTGPARHFGQQQFTPCLSTEYESLLLQRDPSRKATQQFEQWLAPKTALAKAKRLQKNGQDNEPITIPVVVHIIHDGDAIGQDENIADGQVLSQITVLNQDFRKMEGTPGFNTNPVGADTGIEFCLAKRDPQGYYSSGIVRHNLGDSSMSMDEIEIIKTQTQWDPEKYLNIWVVNSIVLEGGMQSSGYAQFPTNSGIEGLDDLGLPITANTDGVVLVNGCFGSEDIFPSGIYFPGTEKGHIAAHEIGHFLGLRHIWGDGSDCTATDFCNDTPAAAQPNLVCAGLDWDSCPDRPGIDMVENYMDYTSDICKNIFTLDQKDRMLAVLANSPRRGSLLTSNACEPGLILDNDGSINTIGIDAFCDTSFTPSVELTNIGNNAITATAVSYNLDGGTASVYNWTGNLAAGQHTTLSLPEITTTAGQHSLNVSLSSVNGAADLHLPNNSDTQPVSFAKTFNTQKITITIMTDFYGEDTSWRLFDSNGNTVASAANFLSEQQTATVVDVISGECYNFTIYDSMYDGICCLYGDGFYKLEATDGTLIAEGGSFKNIDSRLFRIDTTLGTDNFDRLSNVSLYPNPTGSILNIAMPDGATMGGTYSIYNNLGQLIGSGELLTNQQTIDVSGFAKGSYFIKLITGDTSKTLKFIKN
jgi:hypothetical protein